MANRCGGIKRKIPIEKITKKGSRATCFTKRSHGLFSKASQFCLLSGAQIAILSTPPSSQSHVSFYSFGHSSVDAVTTAFLAGERPVPAYDSEESKHMREDVGTCLACKDLGLGLWWEDENLNKSENPEELKDAISSMSRLMSNLKDLSSREAVKNQAFFNYKDLKNNEIKKTDLDQTLNLQSTSAICSITDDCIREETEIIVLDDDLPENFNGFVKNNEEILAISDNLCVTESKNNTLPAENLAECSNQEMDLDQLINFDPCSESFLFDDGVFESMKELKKFGGSLLTNTNTEAVDYVSMETTNPNMLFSDSKAIDEDEDLRFSAFCNELTRVPVFEDYKAH